MTIARRDIIKEEEESAYHCISRCVRRAFLCGLDQYSGRDFEHRRQWIKDRLIFLSRVFGLDVLGYAVMSNHLHVILRFRPQAVQAWSDEEVARRWLVLHPPRDPILRTPRDISDEDISRIAANFARVVQLRHRLGSISWFMSHLDEHIARQANKEDACKGRFWEGRFKCQRLLDEAALLACMVYVELNPIRGKLAEIPEESEFTSAHDRIKSRQAKEKVRLLESASALLQDHQRDAIDRLKTEMSSDDWLCPIAQENGRSGAFRQLTLDEYLKILDATGRMVRFDKRGCVPADMAPVLERLSVNTTRWIDTVCEYEELFRRTVGCLKEVLDAARASGRKWFQGVKACREAFCSTG